MGPIAFERQIACLIDDQYQFANNKTYVCSRVENVVSDDFINSKKRGKKPNSRGSSDFCRICASSFAVHVTRKDSVLNGVGIRQLQ